MVCRTVVTRSMFVLCLGLVTIPHPATAGPSGGSKTPTIEVIGFDMTRQHRRLASSVGLLRIRFAYRLATNTPTTIWLNAGNTWRPVEVRGQAGRATLDLPVPPGTPSGAKLTATVKWNPRSICQAKLLDVNLATARQLQQLPGIGTTLARRIAAKEDSSYTSLFDLLRVKGIGPKRLRALVPQVTTGAAVDPPVADPSSR